MTDFKSLPVYKHKNQILDALKNNQVIIVESPTGSGKTTQIPLILKEAGYDSLGIIGITQPRRIATLGVCSFIKNQLNDNSNFCAYKMRFYDTTDSSTRIKILTDGMLLQEIKSDSFLSSYSVIMIDEAHERSLNIDFILGLIKNILPYRDSLKVIISSATINTKVFSRFFNNAPIISINAKIYDVTVKYFPLKTKGDSDQLSHSICTIINVLLKRFKASDYKNNEDTLVFLPGEFDIKNTLNEIYYECDTKHLQLYPLYGRLNKEEQELVFEDTQEGKMKVVLATNIAETSLTIDGIKVVIDSGLAKINYYNQNDFTSSLILRPISRSSAQQRKGRCGRTSEGTCYRLYSEDDFNSRPLFTLEEILRTDLSEVVLRMVDLGITDFENFPYITKPDSRALKSGEKTLLLLNAITKDRKLTEIGSLMVRFPLLPRHSRCIVEAINRYPHMIESVSIALSFLSGRSPFLLPVGEEDIARNAHRRFSSSYGDFFSYQSIYKKYKELSTQKKREDFCKSYYLDSQSMDEILHITEQLCQISRSLGLSITSNEISNAESFAHDLLLCLGSGLLQYVCLKKKKSVYRNITTDEIFIHPGSAWFRNPPSFILAGEIVLTTKMYARTVSPLKSQWVSEISSNLYKSLTSFSKVEKETNTTTKKVIEEKKSINIFNMSFPVIKDGKKNIAIIDVNELSNLAKCYRKSPRRPKSFTCALLVDNRFVSYGERLYDIVSLNQRVNFNKEAIVEKLCTKVFALENIEELINYLSLIMRLSPLKNKNRLGFVELLISGKNSVFFHVNKSFSDAINNSSYTLLNIIDNCDDKAFKKTYNRILRLLD